MKLSAVKSVIEQKSTHTAVQSLLIMVLTLGASSSLLADHEHHEHEHHDHASAEAHVHGEAELNIVVDGEDVLIEFISPLENLLGFEYAPETAEQKRAYQELETHLTDYRALFSLSNAQCEQTEQHNEAPFSGEHAGHAEWHGEYHLHCKGLDGTVSLQPTLFSSYPGVEKLNIQLITGLGQSQFILSDDNGRIPLQ
jgi:hypothetical protein